MADSEKDLPDPLDTPAGNPTADADDLVAQLAGDAIDRLLEDAEKGIVPPRPKPEDDPLNEIDPLEPPASATNAPASTSSTSSAARASEAGLDLDTTDEPDDVSPTNAPTDAATDLSPAAGHDASDEPSDEPEPLAPTADPVTAHASLDESANDDNDNSVDAPDEEPNEVPEVMQAELDSLFNSLGGDDSAAPSVEDSPAAEPAPLDTARPSMPPPVDVPPEIANDDGHGGATSVDDPSDDADDRPTDLDNDASLQTDVKLLLGDAGVDASSGAPAFIVAPLRLLNAPFAGLSDHTRDLLGQIALVTLVNALAIMLYVILFR